MTTGQMKDMLRCARSLLAHAKTSCQTMIDKGRQSDCGDAEKNQDKLDLLGSPGSDEDLSVLDLLNAAWKLQGELLHSEVYVMKGINTRISTLEKESDLSSKKQAADATVRLAKIKASGNGPEVMLLALQKL